MRTRPMAPGSFPKSKLGPRRPPLCDPLCPPPIVAADVRRRDSPQHLPNDLPMHVRQPSINAIVPESEPGMIDSQQVQNGGMNVIDFCGMVPVKLFVAPFIAWSVCDPALD